MKHRFFRASLFLGMAGIMSIALWTCAPKSGQPSGNDSTNTAAGAAAVAAATADHGKYLVKSMGGGDCHTHWTLGPQGPAPDMTRQLSGFPAGMKIAGMATLSPPWAWAGDVTMTAFSGPWGVSFGSNLTPDSATGLGAWSQEAFVNSIRTGKHMGKGREFLPPMPWAGFANLTDQDLGSMYLYLRTVPPISNKVPDPIMNPNIGGMGGPPPAKK